jgi:hypothetical protein
MPHRNAEGSLGTGQGFAFGVFVSVKGGGLIHNAWPSSQLGVGGLGTSAFSPHVRK